MKIIKTKTRNENALITFFFFERQRSIKKQLRELKVLQTSGNQACTNREHTIQNPNITKTKPAGTQHKGPNMTQPRLNTI